MKITEVRPIPFCQQRRPAA